MWSAISNTKLCPPTEKVTSAIRILLLGEMKTGKTSIAFRMAYDTALEGSIVLFVCLHNKIRNNFPLMTSFAPIVGDEAGSNPMSDGDALVSTWSPVVLSRIMFKYVSNSAELKKLCASMHMLHPRPHCVVIDDFTLVIDPMSTVCRQDLMFVEVCQTLGAYIVDAIDFLDKGIAVDTAEVTGGDGASTSYRSSQKTKLVITSDCLESSFINLMLRYAPTALLIQPILSDETLFNRRGSGVNNTFSHPDGHHNDHRKRGVRIAIRNKSYLSGMEDKILFSSIVISNGRLICTTPIDAS